MCVCVYLCRYIDIDIDYEKELERERERDVYIYIYIYIYVCICSYDHLALQVERLVESEEQRNRNLQPSQRGGPHDFESAEAAMEAEQLQLMQARIRGSGFSRDR